MRELKNFSSKTLGEKSVDFDQEVAVIVSKIESNRYRSPQLFLNDVKYIIEVKIGKKLLSSIMEKEVKDSVNIALKGMMIFMKERLESKLEM